MTSARSYRWTSLVGLGLHAMLARRAGALADRARWAQQTASVQIHQLRTLLEHASRTEFGREHEFDRLLSLPDAQLVGAYGRAVPPRDWYGFQSQLARMRLEAEPDVLWQGLVEDFAQTSGTTAGDKFIPVSAEMKRSNFRAALDIFAHAINFGLNLPDVMAGKCLFLGGSTTFSTSDKGIRTGDLSGIAAKQIRWPLSSIYSPGPDIALMDDWPKKIEAMAQLTIDQDVRFISGMPSWGLVLFQRLLQLAQERGRSVSTLRELWPNLRIFVHGGVRYGPFDHRVQRLWSGLEPGQSGADIPLRLELYPASEGFVAIQDTPGDPGLRLLVDNGIFFEFIPLEDIDKPSPPAFTADRAEPGQRYVVTLTTCAGLWRYILGDVVVFDTIPAPAGRRVVPGDGFGPARLRIVGRHKHFINAFGENLIVEHIERAVEVAAARTGVRVGEFTAAPVYPSASTAAGLELAVELDPYPAADDAVVVRFAHAFDQALKEQNVDYTTKRTSGLGMGPPTVTPLQFGAFHRWMASRGKLGGQHKCPRCANHREIIEAVVGVRTSPVQGRAGHPAAR